MADETEKPWTTRRAPHMERYVEIKPCSSTTDEHRVMLVVEQQSFEIGPYPSEDKEHAEWLRDMLCVALAKLVRLETSGDRSINLAPDDFDAFIKALEEPPPPNDKLRELLRGYTIISQGWDASS
jgi:uncharacterized protein DUF1778